MYRLMGSERMRCGAVVVVGATSGADSGMTGCGMGSAVGSSVTTGV